MIGLILFLILSLMGVAALFLLVRGHAGPISDWDALPSAIEAVDLAAFRNLTDRREDEWLREQLAPREYSQVRRERLAAAADYLGRTNRNAAVLIRLGQAAVHSPDPAVAAAGRELVSTAMRTRWYTMQALARLQAARLVPVASPSVALVAEHYQALREGVDRVSRLRSPLLAARMTAAM
jgi:hypothetical protein